MSFNKLVKKGMAWVISSGIALQTPFPIWASQSSTPVAPLESTKSLQSHSDPISSAPSVEEISTPEYPFQSETEDLRQQGFELLHRVQYGRVPGIQGDIWLTELDQYEDDLKAYGQKVTSLTSNKESLFPTETVVLAFFDYFEHVARALAIRTFFDSTFHDNSVALNWLKKLNLSIDTEKINDVGLLEALAKSKLSYDPGKIPFSAELSSERNPVITLSLKPSYISGFREQKIAQSPDMDSFDNTAAFIASSLMLDNYFLLQAYSGNAIDDSQLSIPKLKEKFPSLTVKASEWKDKFRWLQEVELKKSILTDKESVLRAFSTLVKNGYFVDSEFLISLLNIMNPEQEGWFFSEDETVQTQLTNFQNVELEQTLQLLESNLLLSDLPVTLDANSLSIAVFEAWIRAKVAIFKSGLLTDDSLTEDQYLRIKEVINKQADKIRGRFTVSKASTQLVSLSQKALRSLKSNVASEYLEQITKDSQRMSEVNSDFLKLPVDMSLLTKALKDKLSQLKITPSLSGILQPALAAENFTLAQLTYHKILIDSLGDSQFQGRSSQDTAEIQSAEEILKSIESWTWTNALEKSNNPRTKAFAKGSIERRKKDLETLIKVGQLFGFFLPIQESDVKISDVLHSKEDQKSYQAALKEKLLFQFPVLAIQVPYSIASKKRGRNGTETRHLWEVLASPSVNEKNKKDALRYSQTIIKANIEKSLALIQDQYRTPTAWEAVKQFILPKHYQNTDSQRFNKLVSQSVVLAHRLQSHPLFFELYGEFARKVDTNTTSGNLWRTFYGNYVELGFTMLIAYQLVQFFSKFVFPRFSSFIKSMEIGIVGPYLNTFMATSMGFIGIHLLNGGYENFSKDSQHLEDMKQFYYSSIQGNTLFNFSDIEEQEKEYREKRVSYYWEIGLLGGFIVGLSIILPLASKAHTALRLRKAKKVLLPSFNRLGFPQGKYTFFEAELESMYAATLRQINSGPYPRLIAARLKNEYQTILHYIQREQAYWDKLALRNQYQFKDLGLKVGEWDPKKIDQTLVRAKEDVGNGQITIDRYQVIKHSGEALKKVMRPELMKSVRDPFARALYARIWNIGLPKPVEGSLYSQRYRGEYNPDEVLSQWSQEELGYRFIKTTVSTEVNGRKEDVTIFTPERAQPYKYDPKWAKDIEELDKITEIMRKAASGVKQ
ncbi:MAG: hypothetical protein KDD61_05505 [Bdellovibrionales bacterium]|nr:hypothetical protein [Bdellovibrionales bacterium]